MIQKIDIDKFGLFKDFEWRSSIGNSAEDIFKRVNIIYGRNYSGKTTLSRIMRCLETKNLHEHYLDGIFSVSLSDQTFIQNTSLATVSDAIQVRVYNTDFVRDHLSWLHNNDGSIKPFTILGAKNVELDKKIKDIEDKLGNEELKTGLLFDLFEKNKNFEEKSRNLNSKQNDLDGKLRQKAVSIKSNSALYNVPTYQINSIKGEIPAAEAKGVLSDEEIENKKKLLKEEALENVLLLSEPKFSFSEYFTKTKELTSRKIAPSQPIIDLVNDNLLQEWVRQGIDKHKDKREACGFCGSLIPDDLWDKLDAHFSKESEELRAEIAQLIKTLNKAKENITEYLKLDKDGFYVSNQRKFIDLSDNWAKETKKYIENIHVLVLELEKREKDIFKEVKFTDPEDNSLMLSEIIKEMNVLIGGNNGKTISLATDQKDAKNALRLSEVAKFILDIEYNEKIKEIEALEREVEAFKELKNTQKSQIDLLLEEKRKLEAQAKDESKGAELVNEHLSRYFGHDELKLVAEGEAPNMKFKITRGTSDAQNLSEGECSLISFCYFIARMEDEMKDELNNGKLILYIDDPISSLDSNHIFFMFSLIESIIAKPKKYGQLFISTHNLDFLKYLKRITPPGKNTVSHFLIERRQMKNEKNSFLVRMPLHIKNYVTEFNYLFNEIYKVYLENQNKKDEIETTYNQFYNLPNNLRKFLECYLFYKFPNNDDPLKNLDKLFDDNVPSLINRVINEYSHLTYIDRGWKPIDVDEAEECAKLVIEKIKEKDLAQFNALVESLN